MKTRLLMSAMCAAAMSLCAAAAMNAQRAAARRSRRWPFHPVENFFHYPAYSVIGRLSGVRREPDRPDRRAQSRAPSGARVQGRRDVRALVG